MAGTAPPSFLRFFPSILAPSDTSSSLPNSMSYPHDPGGSRGAGTSSSFTHQPKDINFFSSSDFSLLNAISSSYFPPSLPLSDGNLSASDSEIEIVNNDPTPSSLNSTKHIPQKISSSQISDPVPPSFSKGNKVGPSPALLPVTRLGNVSLLMSQLFLVPVFFCLKSTAQRLTTTFWLTKLPPGTLYFFRPTCSAIDITLIARAFSKFLFKARKTSSPLYTLSPSANILVKYLT